MPLRSDCVGLEVTTGPLEVPARWLLACAAALGLEEERFADDARAGGLVAPPFICTRFEWMLQSRLRVHEALGLTAGETRRGVHFVQDSRFLADLRPGMRVVATGAIQEVRPVKAGALVRYRYRLDDLGTGNTLIETCSISIFRDVAVPDGARTIAGETVSSPNAPEPVDLADAAQQRIAVSRPFVHVYTECLDIWNPVHTERTVAVAAGLPDIILHGTATWALAGRDLMRCYAGTTGRLTRLSGRFSGNVLLPASLTIRHRPIGPDLSRIRFDVLGPDHRAVISDGEAAIAP